MKSNAGSVILVCLLIILTACNAEIDNREVQTIQDSENLLIGENISPNDNLVKFAVGEWAPYVSQEIDNYGFTSAIVKAAYREVGIEIKIEFYPWTRAVMMTENALVVGSFPWVDSNDYSETYIKTVPFCTSIEKFVYLKSNKNIPEKIISDDDLKHLKICGIKEYTNLDIMLNRGFDVEVCNNELEALTKVLNGRIDTYPANPHVVKQMLKEHFPNQTDQVAYLEPPLIEQGMALFISKEHPQSEFYRDKFNEGFKLIVESGKYDEILEDYELKELGVKIDK